MGKPKGQSNSPPPTITFKHEKSIVFHVGQNIYVELGGKKKNGTKNDIIKAHGRDKQQL
jgi:hypothetical protein